MINKKNIQSLNELDLHDMELLDIKIDYSSHKVEISLKERQKYIHILLFEHMQSFSIDGFEPWGEGMYVSEVKAITTFPESLIKKDDECVIDEEAFLTEILINSGDKIKVLSTHIQLYRR